MLIDKRIEKLAHGLVDFSCDVQKGENVLIEATGVDYQLVASLVKEVYAKGAYPFVNLTDLRIKREWMKGMSAELAKKICGYGNVPYERYASLYSNPWRRQQSRTFGC